MTATKTNERPGTRAVHRYCGMSASKARQVLDLIRGQEVQRAAEILSGVEREAAEVIGKVLTSAVANAAHNDQQNPEDLYVSACYADEGATMKRWRPRARGRATRIRKRTCHITIIVSRLPAEQARAAPPAHGGGQRQPLAAGRRLAGPGRPDRSPVAAPGRPRPRRPRPKRPPPKRPRADEETTDAGRDDRGRRGPRPPRRTRSTAGRTRRRRRGRRGRRGDGRQATRARRVRASRWARR